MLRRSGMQQLGATECGRVMKEDASSVLLHSRVFWLYPQVCTHQTTTRVILSLWSWRRERASATLQIFGDSPDESSTSSRHRLTYLPIYLYIPTSHPSRESCFLPYVHRPLIQTKFLATAESCCMWWCVLLVVPSDSVENTFPHNIFTLFWAITFLVFPLISLVFNFIFRL